MPTGSALTRYSPVWLTPYSAWAAVKPSNSSWLTRSLCENDWVCKYCLADRATPRGSANDECHHRLLESQQCPFTEIG